MVADISNYHLREFNYPIKNPSPSLSALAAHLSTTPKNPSLIRSIRLIRVPFKHTIQKISEYLPQTPTKKISLNLQKSAIRRGGFRVPFLNHPNKLPKTKKPPEGGFSIIFFTNHLISTLNHSL